MNHHSINPAKPGLDLDTLHDIILPAGAESCFKGTEGSLVGKSTKATGDSTGVTVSLHATTDCTGTASETTKVAPGVCTEMVAAYSKDGKVQYAYLGGSPGACEAGLFKGYCRPSTGSAATAGISIAALAGLAVVAIANFA